MSNIQIRVIEDQYTEDKVIENQKEAIQEYVRKNGVNQNPFIEEEDQIKSHLNQQSNNNYHKFAPKQNDRLTNREVKTITEDEFNIQIEIRTDMPTNR